MFFVPVLSYENGIGRSLIRTSYKKYLYTFKMFGIHPPSQTMLSD